MREETLSNYPHPVIEIACRYCDRRGRYRRERLIREHGGGLPIASFVRMVSRDCGFAEVRTGRKGCNGPYVVPAPVYSPTVPKECMLVKVKKPL